MSYQTPEDKVAFEEILARDPESRRCFECGYDNAPWCDVSHGTFVCLDCSGRFRGLGVHLAFVRCSTMDGWSDWKPEKLRQMQCGGNGRARRYFEQHGGIGDKSTPLKDRYSTKVALMYRDKLEAESLGRPFDERTWQPPQWWQDMQREKQNGAQQLNNASGAASGSAQRMAFMQQQQRQQQQSYGSYGSQQQQQQGQQGKSSSGGGVDDFLSYLGTAASSVAELSSKAAAEAVARSKMLADTVEKSAKEVEVGKTLDSAWGWASSWTSAGITAVSTFAKSAAEQVQHTLEGDDGKKQPQQRANSGNNNDDDGGNNDLAGLGALTRNVRPSQQDYGHAEHRPERGGNVGSNDLHSLTGMLKPSNKYEGIGGGGSPVTANAPISKSLLQNVRPAGSPGTGTSPGGFPDPQQQQQNQMQQRSFSGSSTPPQQYGSSPASASLSNNVSSVNPRIPVAVAPPSRSPVAAKAPALPVSGKSGSAATPTTTSSGGGKGVPQDWGWDE